MKPNLIAAYKHFAVSQFHFRRPQSAKAEICGDFVGAAAAKKKSLAAAEKWGH